MIDYTHIQVIPLKTPKVVSLSELDEWEECSSTDDDCELIEIADDESEIDEDDEVVAPYHRYTFSFRNWPRFVINMLNKASGYATM